MDPLGTVVRYVDTQVLARDTHCWYAPNKEQIGLKKLVEILRFEHSDPHTAANDAGRTLISAFQLGIGDHECRDKNKVKKEMLEVASAIEEYSVASFKSIGGVKEYCWRCGQNGHMKSTCTATDLHCDECEANECELQSGEDHITLHCMCLANKKATLRRERDALARLQKKHKNKYTPRRRSFSRENDWPHSRDSGSRPYHSPSQTPYPRQMNGHDFAFNSRRGQPSNGNWRARSSNGFNNGNNSSDGSSNGVSNGFSNGSSGHVPGRDHEPRDGSEM